MCVCDRNSNSIRQKFEFICPKSQLGFLNLRMARVYLGEGENDVMVGLVICTLHTHPRLYALATHVGCGVAGYCFRCHTDKQMALSHEIELRHVWTN